MSAWYTARRAGWSVKAVIAAGLLAVLLVAALPVALFVGVLLMLFGHVIGGLALFGATAAAAAAAVMIAGLSGVRQLRRIASGLASRRDYRIVQLLRDDYRDTWSG